MKNLFWIVAAVLAAAPSFAQDSSADFDALAGAPTETPSASWGKLAWAGEQAFAWRQGVVVDPTRTGGSVDSTLGAAYTLGDFKLVGAASVRNDAFVPGETALFWSPGAFRFGVGLREFSWGVADAKNPTDTLNARDYRFGADAPRLVNPAATVAVYPASWLSVEGVWEPWKEASQFPKDFEANTQAGLTKAATTLKNQIAYLATLDAPTYGGLSALLNASYNPVVTAQDGERYTYDQPVYGGRVNLFLPGADLAFSYLHDRDTYYTPDVTLKQFGTLWLPDKVDLVVRSIDRFGLNAKTTWGPVGLWTEAAYNWTGDFVGTDDAVRNSKLAWTIGLDFSYGPSGTWYANLQYAGEWIPGYDSATSADYADLSQTEQMAILQDKAKAQRQMERSLVQSLGSETEESLHAVTYSLKFPLGDSGVTPTFSGAVLIPQIYDATAQTRLASAFFKPELDWAPADGVHVLFGADLAYGWVKKAGSGAITLDTATDKLGVYTPQNNLYVKVQYQWAGSTGN